MGRVTEAQRVAYNKQRARKAGCEATLTLSEWSKTIRDFNGKCAYCLTAPYEVLEHFVPLIWKGGTTAANCIPCCSRCNSRNTCVHPYHLLRHEKWKDACTRIHDYLASRKKTTE